MGVTLGATGQPGQLTLNLDSVFSLSLAAYRKELIDNIGASNAFFHEMIKGELYEGQDGGTDIQIPLMYALTPMDSYDGYDELSTVPSEGITQAIYQWRQTAAPIVYSMKEAKQNKQRIQNLVKARIKQTEMGMQEGFSQHLMWGSLPTGGSLISPYVSPINGSQSVDPIWLFIQKDPTASSSPGGIDQSSYSWWRNRVKTAAATTYDGHILEVENHFNTVALGSGGKPKLILCDQVSYELTAHALYQKYRYTQSKVDDAYPFENFVYKGAHFVMDDKVPDLYNALSPTETGGVGDPTTLTNGSMAFINPQYFKLVYEEDSDFVMLKDENGKTFQKPINGDSRVAHVAWMGNTTCSNRRKQGLLMKIARTLTTP